MNILWLNWKDKSHPRFGGAEVVNEELARRLVHDGHRVTFIVAQFPGSKKEEEERDGFRIIRVGGRYSLYWCAYQLYKKQFKGKVDLVIDEMNTIPFFTRWYVHEKSFLFVHQLCREIWFYQTFFPLNVIGYILEPLYLWLISNSEVVTVSQSTKRDLMRFGFTAGKIYIISEGIDIEPLPTITSKNFEQPMLLILGRCDPMKRTTNAIQAFELVKEKVPTARLVIAGVCNGAYGERIRFMSESSRYKESIEITGPISHEQKISLLRDAFVLISTSVKEGWGLVVTEANSQGTPAAVYNVDGLRDSVKDGETGCIVTQNNPRALAVSILKLFADKDGYERLRSNAWQWSKEITFDKSYQQFLKILQHE